MYIKYIFLYIYVGVHRWNLWTRGSSQATIINFRRKGNQIKYRGTSYQILSEDSNDNKELKKILVSIELNRVPTKEIVDHLSEYIPY